MSGRPLVDPRSVAQLDDGWCAVIAVGVDGTATPWLLDPAGHGGVPAPPCPAHEHLGPLPPAVAARLARPVQPRCGRARKDGGICRSPVARHGDVCGNHRRTTAAS